MLTLILMTSTRPVVNVPQVVPSITPSSAMVCTNCGSRISLHPPFAFSRQPTRSGASGEHRARDLGQVVLESSLLPCIFHLQKTEKDILKLVRHSITSPTSSPHLYRCLRAGTTCCINMAPTDVDSILSKLTLEEKVRFPLMRIEMTMLTPSLIDLSASRR